VRFVIANERLLEIAEDKRVVLDPRTGSFVPDESPAPAGGRELTEKEFGTLVAARRVEVLYRLCEQLAHLTFLRTENDRDVVTLEHLNAAFGPRDPAPVGATNIRMRVHPLGFGIVELDLPPGTLTRAVLETRFGNGREQPRLHTNTPFVFGYDIAATDPVGRCSLFANCVDDAPDASVISITFRTETPTPATA
jgi:hypothetical protein